MLLKAIAPALVTTSLILSVGCSSSQEANQVTASDSEKPISFGKDDNGNNAIILSNQFMLTKVEDNLKVAIDEVNKGVENGSIERVTDQDLYIPGVGNFNFITQVINLDSAKYENGHVKVNLTITMDYRYSDLLFRTRTETCRVKATSVQSITMNDWDLRTKDIASEKGKFSCNSASHTKHLNNMHSFLNGLSKVVNVLAFGQYDFYKVQVAKTSKTLSDELAREIPKFQDSAEAEMLANPMENFEGNGEFSSDGRFIISMIPR